MLFIEASREFREGSAQNYLREEDVQKIAAAFHAFKDVDRSTRAWWTLDGDREERFQSEHQPLRRDGRRGGEGGRGERRSRSCESWRGSEARPRGG